MAILLLRLGLLISCISTASYNQSVAQESSEPVVLEHADQLISAGGSGDIVNLVGNVHFSHEKADLYSNRATWYRKSGLIQFLDSVLVKDESRRITARTMTYYRRDRRVTALDDVILIDSGQDVILKCDKADYFRGPKQFDAYGKPQLVFNPEDDTARLEINALKMSYFSGEKRGIAIDSVSIIRHDLTATGGQADFFREPEQVILTRAPVILQEGNRLSGDSISIFMENKKIQRLLVRGNASAFYRTMPDTLVQEYTTAELNGREIEAFFADDRIELMITRYNASSLYNPAVTDTLVSGTNIASGDSITLHFENSIIKQVLISGGAQGEYIEQKLSEKGEVYGDTTRYSGDLIDYKFADAEISLYENGTLKYRDMILNAGDIKYNTDTRILVARGLGSDTSDEEIQNPVLKQGSEELVGERMSYNLETRKGQVRMARTKFEGGYYTGESIRQASKDVLFVAEGNYTSCDKPENPHYLFHSDKMKMIGKDKVVARPVVLYIGRLPVFAVPYYVFPIRKGRHSGFLTFEIGNFERGERFIRNVGYYWAASEYWDLTTSLDFYENSRTIINGALQYQIRYRLSGNVGVNFSRNARWDQYVQRINNRWRMTFSHNQNIAPATTLSGSGTFVSDKSFVPDNIFDPSERLERTISSNLSFNTKWGNSPFTVTARQDWNLDTDTRREVLPQISFSRSSIPLFPERSRNDKKERSRPGEEIAAPVIRFYNSVRYSFSTTALNARNRNKVNDSTFVRKDYQTLNTGGRLEAPQKLFGVYTVNPVVTFTHLGARLEANEVLDSMGLATEKFVTQTRYSLGVNSSTNLYGTISPGILGVTGIRHTMTPSLNYSFTPEIKKNERYFSYVGLGGGSGRSKSLGYGLANVFQLKYLAGEAEKKLDIFTLGFSGNYNFAADSVRFSPLSTSLRTSAIPNISLDYTASHSFYELNSNTRRPLQRLRLERQSITSSVSFSLKPSGEGKREETGESGSDARLRQAMIPKVGGAGQFTDVGLNGSMSFSYTETRGLIKNITQRVNFNLDAQPTKNWKVQYFCHYDPKAKRIESQSVNIGRDLHCWQAEFSWIPSGNIAGYYVKISIKELPDIKVEKSEGGLQYGRY